MITLHLSPTSLPVKTNQELIALTQQLGPAADAVLLTNKAVGTSSTPIGHGQKGPPAAVFWAQRGNATVWRSADPDSANVYLQASTATTVDLLIVKGGT